MSLILMMDHKQRVEYFRSAPPTMGSNATEYHRGLTGAAQPMSVRDSVGYSAFYAGKANREQLSK